MSHARRNAIPYLALLLVLVVGAGGGYAYAASKTKTITVCADKKTGILHLHNHGRCKRGQARVTWNQKGPQGLQGVPGPAGQPGTPAVNIWAIVSDAGTVAAGQGISAQRLGPGQYEVTITSPACAQSENAPMVTVEDSDPPSGHTSGFPEVWFGSTGVNQFMVFTGDFDSGSFSLSDHTFDVMDTCA